eukprot:TRINITY_DN7183_c0_g1_i2.p1 TRINITY_DN7183_c0_g1~~TRINITY_DN7183_c0_g1_i2.p1  ORF type:complete len:694 (+),score=209.78 TRINITY_DN7183_c0_g1_i2:106-2187(+)
MGRKSTTSLAGAAVEELPEPFQIIEKDFRSLDIDQQQSLLEVYKAGGVSVEEINNSVQELIQGTFDLKYLGSVPVAAAKLTPTMLEMFGAEVISTAWPRLKALKRKPIDVRMSVTQTGVRTVNPITTEALEDDNWTTTIFAGVDAKDKKRLGYLAFYSKLGLIFCHVYTAKDKVCQEVASRIMGQVAKQPLDSVAEQDRHQKATGATLGIFETQTMSLEDDIEKSAPSLSEITLNRFFAVRDEFKALKSKPDSWDRVVLVVSSEGIRIVDAISREVVRSIFITDIKFVTEIKDKKQVYFGITLSKDNLNTLSCGLFLCNDKDANKICSTVKQAFKVAQEDVAARKGNPFMPMSSVIEAVQGDLAEAQIPRIELKAIKPLGAGQFGEVYLAHRQTEGEDPRKCAVKMLRGVASAADKDEFLHEAEIMARLNHPNLVKLEGVCAKQRPWLMVLAFCHHGDLHAHLVKMAKRKRTMQLNEQIRAAYDIAQGLAYVASQRIVHLDVAARNCLLHNDKAQIADFGIARNYQEGKPYFRLRASLKLSIRWLAPEALGPPPKLLSEYSDVWSWGITFNEIFNYGRLPYRHLQLKSVPRAVLKGERPKQPSNCPDAAYTIMQDCWSRSPTLRSKFRDIVEALEALKATCDGPSPRPYPAMLSDDAVEKEEEEELDMTAATLDEVLKQYAYPEGLSDDGDEK